MKNEEIAGSKQRQLEASRGGEQHTTPKQDLRSPGEGSSACSSVRAERRTWRRREHTSCGGDGGGFCMSVERAHIQANERMNAPRSGRRSPRTRDTTATTDGRAATVTPARTVAIGLTAIEATWCGSGQREGKGGGGG